MKKRPVGFAICFVALQAIGAQPEDDQVKKGLVGSWECTLPKFPAEFKDVKHITTYLARFQTCEYGLPIPTCVNVSPSTLSLNLKVWPIIVAVLSLA